MKKLFVFALLLAIGAAYPHPQDSLGNLFQSLDPMRFLRRGDFREGDSPIIVARDDSAESSEFSRVYGENM